MWFVLLSSALAQDVVSRPLDGGAEFTLTYADGETVSARFYGGVFETGDAERAMGLLGDHLLENLDVFRTGGGGGWVDVDLGAGSDLGDDWTSDLAGVDVRTDGSACGVTTSVGDVLVSFGVDVGLTDEGELGDAPDGYRADTGGLADGDAGDSDDASEYATGSDVSFTGTDPDSVDAIYDAAMDRLFGDGSGGAGTSLDAHEATHIVQSGSALIDTGWEGTWDGALDGAFCLPDLAAEANINWNILGVSMYVQPDPTRSDEIVVEGDDIAPIDLIGDALEVRATEAYLRDDSGHDTDPSPLVR